MGSSASKAASKTAAKAAVRQYPTRTAGTPSASPTSSPITAHKAQQLRPGPSEGELGPTIHSRAEPSETRTTAVDLDAQDPHLAASLRAIGPVAQPKPTFSSSSTVGLGVGNKPSDASTDAAAAQLDRSKNPAIMMLAARTRLEKAADAERADAGKRGFEGRGQVDAKTIRRALEMRDLQGREAGEVERALGLREGVVKGFGRRGVVEVA